MKDAQGHGSDTSGGTKSFEQQQREKDAEFVSQLRGWFAGDQQAAQTLANKYGDKSVAVEFHRAMSDTVSKAAGDVAAHAGALGAASREVAGGAVKAGTQVTFGKRTDSVSHDSGSKVTGQLNRQNIGITQDARFNAGNRRTLDGNSTIKGLRDKYRS